ncbi:hypothetical protein [Cupriavidus sp. SW-Y-13]|uniref:hypothetical protein n=1 Tax=Cupriavidus sp. SW-Y-13 TaxID=2653854 RepID=UPI001365CE99|nr:hypothetical protein [Cupriavidus sp. SW-Y-13]MWL88487.1 hypothetical protein [Cupriavidus sp. SW-Y-13]
MIATIGNDILAQHQTQYSQKAAQQCAAFCFPFALLRPSFLPPFLPPAQVGLQPCRANANGRARRLYKK